MILEFIDGTLDSGSEQSLFDNLAAQPELRTELRQYVMIGDAVRSDREAYAPPSDVERRLLGGLGLIPLAGAGGAGAAAAAGGGGIISFLAALKGSLFPLLTGFLLGSLLVGGGVFLWMDSGAGSEVVVASSGADTDRGMGDVRNSSSSEMGLLQKGEEGNKKVASSAWNDKGERNEAAATERVAEDGSPERVVVEKVVEKIVYVPVPDRPQNSLPDQSGHENAELAEPSRIDLMKRRAQENSRGIEPQTRSLIAPEKIVPRDGTDETNLHRSPVPTTPIDQIGREGERSDGSENRLALEFRKGIGTQHFADNNALRVETQFLDDLVRENFAVGASVSTPFLNGWRAGIEGGRERYTQSLFYSQDDVVLIEQRPNITWFGLTIGREADLLGVPLLLQGTIGSSTHLSGPLVRGRVGVDLLDFANLSSSLSLPLSLEASSLVYTFNGQYLVTGNWGASFGVRYDFGF